MENGHSFSIAATSRAFVELDRSAAKVLPSAVRAALDVHVAIGKRGVARARWDTTASASASRSHRRRS